MFTRLILLTVALVASNTTEADSYVVMTQGLLHYRPDATYHFFNHGCANQERPLPALLSGDVTEKIQAAVFKRGRNGEQTPFWIEAKGKFLPAGEDVRTNHDTYIFVFEIIGIDHQVNKDLGICAYEKT